jgi:hypothetical protein
MLASTASERSIRSPVPLRQVSASIASPSRRWWSRSAAGLAGGGRGGTFGELDAEPVRKRGAAVVGERDRVAVLVHEPVVAPTEQHEVVEVRLAAAAPVPHVVGIDKAARWDRPCPP